MKGWEYETEWGRFRIVKAGKAWSVQFEGNELRGEFATADTALAALLEGGVTWPSDLVRLRSIYVPHKLSGWRSIDC